jgi:membrane-bound serine protease (ClpP class)
MPFQFELLQILVNPTIAYLLLLAGLVGLAVELFSGGSTIVPGVFGAISLLLGLYGTAQLPVTLVGIVLLVLGVGLIIAEAHIVPTHGILGAAGVASLVIAGLVLYNTDSDEFEVSVPVVAVTGLLLGGFLAFAVQRTMVAHRRPVMTGWEELVGATGEVRQALDPVGQVFVEGALWRARPADEGRSVERGYRVRVESVDGLTLVVRPIAPGEADASGVERGPGAEEKAQEGAA